MESNNQKKTPRRSYGYGLISFVLITILFSTNPTEIRFKEFLKNNFKEQARPEGPFSQIVAGPTASIVGLTTIKKDYIIFSIYEISILGDKYRYLGILNQFIKMN